MASALITPCDVTEEESFNTGIEGNCALGVAAGIIIVNSTDTWTKADMADPDAFIKARIHAGTSQRFRPVFQGIFDFAYAKESDQTEANPIKGTTRVTRPGGLTFTYTWEGGLCLAGRLAAVQGKSYRYIPFDSDSQFLLNKNLDGTYSGLESSDITANYNPFTPGSSAKSILVLNTPYKKYVRAELFKANVDLTDLNGLIDVDIIKAAAATTTKLIIGVQTQCKKTDLIAKYPTAIADLDLYIVTNKATGAVVTPTAAAVVGGRIELTGTYVTGQTYIVTGSAPSVWLANLIEGYDATNPVEITV